MAGNTDSVVIWSFIFQRDVFVWSSKIVSNLDRTD